MVDILGTTTVQVRVDEGKVLLGEYQTWVQKILGVQYNPSALAVGENWVDSNNIVLRGMTSEEVYTHRSFMRVLQIIRGKDA